MDPLLPLLDLTDVRAHIEAVEHTLQRTKQEGPPSEEFCATAMEACLLAASASAILDGASPESLPETNVDVNAAVLDPRLRRSFRVYSSLDEFVDLWRQAPLQVLARLHTLAAYDELPHSQLGRPRHDRDVSTRLACLADLITTSRVHVAVLASVVHGEILSLAPFGEFSGLVARASARLTLLSGDAAYALTAPEVVHLERYPEYLGAQKTFSSGRSDGVRAWIKHCCVALSSTYRSDRHDELRP